MERLSPVFSFGGVLGDSFTTLEAVVALGGAGALTTAFAGGVFETGTFTGALVAALAFAGTTLAGAAFLTLFTGCLTLVLIFFAGATFFAIFGAALMGLLVGAAFAGAFLAPVEDLTGFPEVFRDGVGLEIFFNGTQLKPKSRAWKVRRSLPSGQVSPY